MSETKKIDRLSVSKEAIKLIDVIDEKKYLNLDKTSVSRTELFLFAMALGIESQAATSIESSSQVGLILDQSIKNIDISLIYALFLNSHISDGNLDDALNKEHVYSVAQQYANTGFQIINDYMKIKSAEKLSWELIKELDAQYAGLEK